MTTDTRHATAGRRWPTADPLAAEAEAEWPTGRQSMADLPTELGALWTVQRQAQADANAEPGEDRRLAVVVADPAGAILGIKLITTEATGEDRHDAIHAIMTASYDLSSGGEPLDWPEPEPAEQ